MLIQYCFAISCIFRGALVTDGANRLSMEITEIQSPLMRLGGSGVYCALVDSAVILLSIGGICVTGLNSELRSLIIELV